jgi:hypothetical protein
MMETTRPGTTAPADPWLVFLENYKRHVSADPLGIAAYQLFTNLRDAGPDLWLKEPLKAIHFSWLSNVGTELTKIQLRPRYDYCFIVDGTAAPGLGTCLPVLRALPPDRRALLIVRDHVARDPRFQELLRSPAFDVINIDRTRTPARQFSRASREMLEVARAFPKGLTSVPKLILRKLHVETVLEQLLERTQLRCLVVCNERLILSGAAIHAARRHGVPTFCLQHGALVDQYLPVIVDTYLTWGAHASAWFRGRGVTARLCDIGAPRTDGLATFRKGDRPKEREASPDRTVAFFTQRPGTDLAPEWTLQVEQEFLKLLETEGRSLWVKLHPADDPARWEKIAAAEPRKVRLLKGGDPYSVIADADYVGAFYSTVLLEAMLFDKPVFQLNPFGDAVPDYSRAGGCAPLRDGAELREWIGRCESDAAFREQVVERQRTYTRAYFSNLGKASGAFYECLESLLPGPPAP